MNEFFWLHVKKAAGTSMRKTLYPKYIQVDRSNPQQFIATDKKYYNDMINNYRMQMGEYTFKRMLFAKKFLYTEQEFQEMYKFVIIRNPYDRIVSAWKYLLPWSKSLIIRPRYLFSKFSFNYFVNNLEYFWDNYQNNLHIATHTAPYWDDITDENENILFDKIIKLEELNSELPLVLKKLDLSENIIEHTNKSKRSDRNYRKYYNEKTKKMVLKLYKNDIEKFNYKF